MVFVTLVKKSVKMVSPSVYRLSSRIYLLVLAHAGKKLVHETRQRAGRPEFPANGFDWMSFDDQKFHSQLMFA